ncbi:MAG TPA: DUF433 domain-containing protein [Isosphaeraceae bacterium]|nr:DUF433 domain-containing protein [Isosphaeraceae bacterium]
MPSQTTKLKGVVRGKTIELEREPDLPDGQAVTVRLEPIKPIPPERSPDEIPKLELWVDRLVFDSSVHPIERIVKGTNLEVEALVAELEQGRSAEDMLRNHPELTQEDLVALREYARIPAGLRRSFGAWAEDAEELDRYIELVYKERRAT